MLYYHPDGVYLLLTRELFEALSNGEVADFQL